MMRNPITAIAVAVLTFAVTSSSFAQDERLPQIPSGAIPTSLSPSPEQLKKFSRVALAIGQRIVLTDSNGILREGVLAETTVDGVTIRTESATQTFAWAEVVSADRLKDESADGALKGALFAALFGGLEGTLRTYVGGIVAWSIIGYLVDAGQVNRQPLYRSARISLHEARPSSAPSIAFRIRF